MYKPLNGPLNKYQQDIPNITQKAFHIINGPVFSTNVHQKTNDK